MNKKQQHQYDKLQKSSILFTQLGLVLALLVVYLALEFSTTKKVLVFDTAGISGEPTTFVKQHRAIIIEKKITPKKILKLKKVVPLVDITIDDNPTIKEIVLDPTDETPTDELINSIEEVPGDDIDVEVTLPFTVIEEVPIYPGCEGLGKEESKLCFTNKITKFVNKRFDTSLAEGLNVSGKQKIWVQFKIDKTGKVVDIIANSPHKSLIKEAVRVVEKLPQMTPGKQRKRPVSVKYTLPIVFFIE